MIDVTHDRDDRRPRLHVLRRIRDDGADFLSLILVLADGLEAELSRNDLDLVEVEALVDGDHEAEILEREADDLRGRDLQDLRELTDSDELVDADQLLLTLDLRRTHRLGFLSDASTVDTSASRARAAQRRHRLGDVRVHYFLIDRAPLPLFARVTARGPGTRASGRWVAALRAAANRTAILTTCGAS